MNYSEFVAEAHRIAKKAVKLCFSGTGAPAAYWHGSGSEGDILISVKYGSSWLNVFLGECGGGSVHVTEAPFKSSRPLFALEFESLPPVDGVFVHGSDAVERFLKISGWERVLPRNHGRFGKS